MLAAPARAAVGCRTARAVGSTPSTSGKSDAYPRTRPTRARSASRGRRAAAAAARARDDGSIEDDGDEPAEWRAGPAPDSSFGSMFAEAMAEASSSVPPPLKRVESDDAPAPASASASAPATLETPPAAAAIDEALRSVDEDPESVASPFCSITFVDESGTFDGEGDFLPPMADPATAAPAPPPPASAATPPPQPIAAWPPWLADESADGGAACAVRATVDVCHGKACTRAGADAVQAAIEAAAPPGWEFGRRSKCVGLCSAACVVRVTEATTQTVHTRVNPTNAAVVVLPGRSYGGGGASPFAAAANANPPPRASVHDVEPSGPSLPWSPPRTESPLPAAAGFLAAATAAVERGVRVEDSAGEGRAASASDATPRRGARKSRRASGAVAAAAEASRRAEELGDVATYDFGAFGGGSSLGARDAGSGT